MKNYDIDILFPEDPKKFLDTRKKVLKQVEDLSMPEVKTSKIKDLDFINMDIKDISLPMVDKIPEQVVNLTSDDVQNIVVVQDGNVVYKKLNDQFKDVYIDDYKNAQKDRSDLLEKYCFRKASRYNENRLTALNMAVGNSGIIIYVPKNQIIKDTLQVIILQENTDLVHHTLVVIDENSCLNYIENYHNINTCKANIVSESVVLENSSLNYTSFDRFCENSLVYSAKRGYVDQYGKLKYAIAQLNEANTISDIQVNLVKEGAYCDCNNVAIAENAQVYDITTKINHKAPYTEGFIHNHGIAKDSSHLVFNGIGSIEKGMYKSNAQQESRAMVLSETARAEANPFLLIDEYDVQAGHAAGVGKVDEDQMYYLMSRGLRKTEAEKLIINGFLSPVIDDLRIEALQKQFKEVIERKINR